MDTRKHVFGGVALGGAEPLFPAAVRHHSLLLLSGQAPVDPATLAVCAPDFAAQARYVMERIKETLTSAGADFSDVLRVECILANAQDFPAWNDLYATSFTAPRPARTTVVAGFVLPGMLIEVQVTAGV